MTKKEKKAVWMRKSDTMAVRREAYLTAREVYNSDNKDHPASYEWTHWNIYESCIMEKNPTSSDVASLAHWTREGTEWRGLEKQTMPELCEQQSRRVKAYVQNVVRLNKVLQFMTPKERDERIFRTATAISYASRRYAELMGKADHDAMVSRGNRRVPKEKTNQKVEIAAVCCPSSELGEPSDSLFGVNEKIGEWEEDTRKRMIANTA
eukprot:CAMPEP_0202444154 /NCGR_PEP_ID=MMETSP1360-20130828/3299_1 /ASSEMBLY_ACC=CAM_ASM_000848 /TAXON_ID=515479 /ORGANISM="Licmophora paradoxa, Strain CCMP2313" /LENGTH=207 /DNA_ID=CAMNT_0049060075 /DNA_START=277 /DNA_END=900 /DNA_ORIENTATION=+